MSAEPASTTPSANLLARRPGKILAVHLSYASRARQRGHTPTAPSYFFKPASSLGSSGDALARPAGTELLAFEGEIALVIGSNARRVPLAEAWQHVAWVTAGNDFGLYDLRANDKGSNVRSKGGDGFTPLGPTLIDARKVDPAALRVRTWVNGKLAQEACSAELLFPLPQFVADLSQHLTLETGDVILTGTPAGSSVVMPGDVVEVEVDTVSGGHKTGRLTTRITAGTDAYDARLGSLPSVTDAQRIAAWGSAAAAGLADASQAMPTLTAALRSKLEKCPAATVSQMLRRRGLNHVTIDGVRPLPGAGKIVGTARTLRFVPNREDLFESRGGGYNAQKRAFDALGAGEVMVIAAHGDAGAGTLGDILASRAKAQGAAGIVTDGAIRDSETVARIGVPVYSNGAHPAVLGRKHIPWDMDVTIGCGGAAVQPGDIIVADADGVVVVPPALAAEVADAALAKEEEDGFVASQVSAGQRLEGLFPMNAEWRERFRAARTDPEKQP